MHQKVFSVLLTEIMTNLKKKKKKIDSNCKKMGILLEKIKQLFTSSSIEVVLIGLENSGKTTLINQLSLGQALPTAPTIGLNVKNLKKGGVNMKVWDIGGQVQYRSEWGRYTKGCDVILFMVDASNVIFYSLVLF